jgi:hypothetical protein
MLNRLRLSHSEIKYAILKLKGLMVYACHGMSWQQ